MVMMNQVMKRQQLEGCEHFATKCGTLYFYDPTTKHLHLRATHRDRLLRLSCTFASSRDLLVSNPNKFEIFDHTGNLV